MANDSLYTITDPTGAIVETGTDTNEMWKKIARDQHGEYAEGSLFQLVTDMMQKGWSVHEYEEKK